MSCYGLVSGYYGLRGVMRVMRVSRVIRFIRVIKLVTMAHTFLLILMDWAKASATPISKRRLWFAGTFFFF